MPDALDLAVNAILEKYRGQSPEDMYGKSKAARDAVAVGQTAGLEEMPIAKAKEFRDSAQKLGLEVDNDRFLEAFHAGKEYAIKKSGEMDVVAAGRLENKIPIVSSIPIVQDVIPAVRSGATRLIGTGATILDETAGRVAKPLLNSLGYNDPVRAGERILAENQQYNQSIDRDNDMQGNATEFRRQMRGALESIGTTLAGGRALGLGKKGLAVLFGSQSAAESLAGSANDEITGTRRYVNAAVNGVIEAGIQYAFGAMGRGGLEKIATDPISLKEATKYGLRSMMKDVGDELLEENATTIGQLLSDKYIGQKTVTVQDFSKALADTTIQTVMTMGLTSTPRIVASRLASWNYERSRKAVSEYLENPSRSNHNRLPADVKAALAEAGIDGKDAEKRKEGATIIDVEPEMTQDEAKARIAEINLKADGQAERRLPDGTIIPEVPGRYLSTVEISELKRLEKFVADGNRQDEVSPSPRQAFVQQEEIADEEMAKALDAIYQQGRQPTKEERKEIALKAEAFRKDYVTGFYEGRTGDVRHTVARRVQEHAAKTGEPGQYVLADVKNLGGLNGELGASEANKVFKALGDILQSGLGVKDADLHMFRHGGDELSALAVNIDEDSMAGALADIEAKIKEYVDTTEVTTVDGKKKLLKDIMHPKYAGDLTRAGTGLTLKSAALNPGRDIGLVFDEVDRALEREKKKGNPHGNDGKAEKAGLGASGGQAGGVAGGAGQAVGGGEEVAGSGLPSVRPEATGAAAAGREAEGQTGDNANRPAGGDARPDGRPLSTEQVRHLAGGRELTEERHVAQEILADPEKFQFKQETDKKTGVQEGAAISEKEVDPTAIGTPVLYKYKDGRLFVVSGHHRLEFLKRKNYTRSFPTFVLNEEDGWTTDDAKFFGARLNIREGGGTVKDYAYYFKNDQGITLENAKDMGLLRGRGAAGWAIGRGLVDKWFGAYLNESINEKEARAVGEGAPGDATAQELTFNAIDGKAGKMKAAEIAMYARFVARKSSTAAGGGQKVVQGGLFGDTFNQQLLADAEAEKKAATEKINELKAEASVIKGIAKNPDPSVLAKYKEIGLNVDDPTAVEAHYKKLQDEIKWWENDTSPEVYKAIQKLAGTYKGDDSTQEETAAPVTNGGLFGDAVAPAEPEAKPEPAKAEKKSKILIDPLRDPKNMDQSEWSNEDVKYDGESHRASMLARILYNREAALKAIAECMKK